MITFTVVTITYNAERVFMRTARSVMSQTYPHVEHIIVDGASKDGTVGMAREYMECSDREGNGHRVSLFSEPDKGLYDAMNKGLARASGEYVVFLNAGDCFHAATTLQDIADAAGINDEGAVLPAVIYGDTSIVDDNGKFLYLRKHRPPERLTWKSFKDGMLVCHQAFYARTDIAREIPYDLRYRYSADVDWCIRIMKKAEERNLRLTNTHLVVADYLREGQSTIHHRASLLERFHVMRRHYGLPSALLTHARKALRL